MCTFVFAALLTRHEVIAVFDLHLLIERLNIYDFNEISLEMLQEFFLDLRNR
jgi:hypothetical protein